MKYIENIDEEFVLDFAKENLKDIYKEDSITVKKVGYLSSEWIVSGISRKYNAMFDISLTDFRAVADGDPLDSIITKLWCKELYKKLKALDKNLGDKYKEDLKENKLSELNANYKRERNQLEENLKDLFS